ncbi:MAG: response regulator [Chloroflexota bacterium]
MSGKLHLLILTDNHHDVELAVAALEQSRFLCEWDQVATLPQFVSRLDDLQTGDYICDLILADYNISDLNDFTTVRLIQERHLDIPCIVLSDTRGEDIAVESLKAGASDYLLKHNLSRLPQAIERALRECRETRQREQLDSLYRDLFEYAADSIYTCDLSGLFTSFNKTAEDLTGYTRAEVLGQGIEYIIAPEYHSLLKDDLHRKRAKIDHKTVYEVEVVCRDQRRIPVEISTRLMYEYDRPVGIQGTARDISERRRAEDEHRYLEAQLRQSQKMEAIGTLAGGIAHDFNNVLTAIIGNAQLILETMSADHPDYLLLLEIEKAATRAGNLTRQLLMFSRRQPMERNIVEINATIHDLSHMFRRLIGEDIEIEMQFGTDISPVFVDPAQTQQILLNLVVNARDAMPDGGLLCIATRNVLLTGDDCQNYPWANPGRYVQIVVCDTGMGMDAETQQRIFDPFFTTKERGTGLGLAVVYGIVKQHGGFMRIVSAPNQGTDFSVFLPACDVSIDTSVANISSVSQSRQETVLIVEDEPTLRQLITGTLEQLGYRVLRAEDGIAAVHMFEQYQDSVDLVVLDTVLPQIDSRDALVRMQALRPDIRALFVAYSDQSEDGITQAVGDSQPIVVMPKPYRIDMLTEKIREVLDT